MKQKKEKTKKKSDKSKKEKSIFHHKSDSGKGDRPRLNITLKEWSDRWDRVFGIKKSNKKSK